MISEIQENQYYEVIEVDSSMYKAIPDKIIDVTVGITKYFVGVNYFISIFTVILGGNNINQCARGDTVHPVLVNQTIPMDLSPLGAEKAVKIIAGFFFIFYSISQQRSMGFILYY